MVPASLAAHCLPLTLSFRILPTSSAFTKAVESLADKSSKVWAQLHTSSALHPFDQTPTSIRTVCRCATWRWWVHSQHQWVPLKGVHSQNAHHKVDQWFFSSHLPREIAWIHLFFLSGSTGNTKNNSRRLCEAIGAINGTGHNRHHTHYL